jgi:uncharacterized protein (DUF2141 family)
VLHHHSLALCLALIFMPSVAPHPAAFTQSPRIVVQPAVPRDPVRDPSRPAATGTGRLRGTVMTDGGAPVPRAQVQISGGSLNPPRMILADASGHYEFTDLPPGQYSVSAFKANYLRTIYGQRRFNGPGKTVALVDRQVLDGIDFVLARAGVVSGRVLDEFGEPMPNVMVQILRPRLINGEPMFQPTNSVQSDDLGQFRLHGLPPGEYVLAANPRPGSSAEAIDGSAYTQTYFPHTLSATDAQRFTVMSGQEIGDVTLVPIRVRMTNVSGLVLSSQGTPIKSASVMLRPSTLQPYFGIGNSDVKPDGTFTLINVPPGEFILEARTQGDDPESAMVAIAVSGDPIAGVMLTLTRGATARGRIVFEGEEPPPFAKGTSHVNPQAIGNRPQLGRFQTEVFDDWTFEVKGLFGRHTLRATAPGGWTQKSVIIGDQDVIDTGYDFQGGATVSGIQIRMTKVVTTIEVAVSDDQGTPVTDAGILVFSTERSRWAVPSRFNRLYNSGSQGKASMRGLPPGEYHIVAMADFDYEIMQDPARLEQLARTAQRMVINEGETRSIDLRVNPVP